MSLQKTLLLFCITYAAPTLLIGFGWIIPHHGVSGWNDLTVGFVGAVFGPLPLLLAVSRSGACPVPVTVAKPWKARLYAYINQQAARPRGGLGFLLGLWWRWETNGVNRIAVDLLDVRRADRILEIGFGPGKTLRRLAKLAPNGKITGIEVSPVMIRLAGRVNACAIASKHMNLLLSHGELPDRLSDYDRVISVHNAYFWPNPKAMLARMAALLSSGGQCVICVRTNDEAVPLRFQDAMYRFYAEDTWVQWMTETGLNVSVETRRKAHPGVRWFVGVKPEYATDEG